MCTGLIFDRATGNKTKINKIRNTTLSNIP
jgi:hypothetical protein